MASTKKTTTLSSSAVPRHAAAATEVVPEWSISSSDRLGHQPAAIASSLIRPDSSANASTKGTLSTPPSLYAYLYFCIDTQNQMLHVCVYTCDSG